MKAPGEGPQPPLRDGQRTGPRCRAVPARRAGAGLSAVGLVSTLQVRPAESRHRAGGGACSSGALGGHRRHDRRIAASHGLRRRPSGSRWWTRGPSRKLAEDAIAAEEARFALARRLADEMIQIAEEETAEGRGQAATSPPASLGIGRRLLSGIHRIAARQSRRSSRPGIDPQSRAGDPGRPDLDAQRLSALAADGSRRARRIEAVGRRLAHDWPPCSSDIREPSARFAAASRPRACKRRRSVATDAARNADSRNGHRGDSLARAAGTRSGKSPCRSAARRPCRSRRSSRRSTSRANNGRSCARSAVRVRAGIMDPATIRSRDPSRKRRPSPITTASTTTAAWRGPGHHHEAEMQKALALLNPEQLARWHEMTGPRFAGLSDLPHARGHDGPHDDRSRTELTALTRRDVR